MDALYTPEDLAEIMGVPVSTVKYWRLNGKGPRAIRVARSYRYQKADIEAWLKQEAEKWTKEVPPPRRQRPPSEV